MTLVKVTVLVPSAPVRWYERGKVVCNVPSFSRLRVDVPPLEVSRSPGRPLQQVWPPFVWQLVGSAP